MKKEIFDSALGYIDDDVIEDGVRLADKYAARGIGRKRLFKKLIVIAAAAMLIILPLGGLVNDILYNSYFGGDVFADSEATDGGYGAGCASPPESPWDNSIYFKLYTNHSSISPSDSVEIYLETGFTRDIYGSGSLKVVVSTKDFGVSFGGVSDGDGVYIFDRISSASHTQDSPLRLTVTLTPEFRDAWASGSVSVETYFIFDEGIDRFTEQFDVRDRYQLEMIDALGEYYAEEGCMELYRASIPYVADRLEIRLGKRGNVADPFWKLISGHYKSGRIDANEFAELYYGELYGYEYLGVMVRSGNREDEGKIIPDKLILSRYIYLSKNIRYESAAKLDKGSPIVKLYEEYERLNDYRTLTTDEINENREETRRVLTEIAALMLVDMRDSGVITEDEYRTECEVLAVVKNIHASYLMGSANSSASNENYNISRILEARRFNR